ncbi:MAG: biotin synthase BioB, partial [[Ruminococcus] gnavus]|nr:biotin synthase BioB [Mediterraneibacter gnavus]
MSLIQEIKKRVLQGEQIGKQEAFQLYEQPLEELCEAADEIRQMFCKNRFDLCTIINGKSGRCSENCKYCAQSACYHTEIEEYPLLGTEQITKQAKYNEKQGALRYSIVTSGKALNDAEIEQICHSVRNIRQESKIAVCVSGGLLKKEQFQKLKEAGVTRIHNNLETSRRNFPNVCTSHTYEQKIESVLAALETGLEVCSGGILGMGESVEDRIDLALEIRKLGVRSMPVNILNPIPGTPYEKNPILTESEIRRMVAVFRFLLPDAWIRLAGGRGLLPDKGRSCFISGANAAISGDMLTTAGITIERDLQMLQELGYV